MAARHSVCGQHAVAQSRPRTSLRCRLLEIPGSGPFSTFVPMIGGKVATERGEMEAIARFARGVASQRVSQAHSAESRGLAMLMRHRRPLAPIRYRLLGPSVLATVGARPAGKPGGLGTCTFLGFFASLLPCCRLLMVVTF